MSSATELAQSLLEVARPFDVSRNPLLVALREGSLSTEAVTRYCTTTARSAAAFPSVIASVLAICPEPRVREALIGNLLEEEGVQSFTAGQRITVDPQRRHAVLAHRLAKAAGATDAELATPMPPLRWFEAAIREQRWIAAFSFFGIGYEANIPQLYRELVPLLRERCGLTAHDLEFLTEHVTADERHGLEAALLIAESATSPDLRRQALEGARHGGLAWWHVHRAHARDPAIA
jgi:pyrroloquinoline quinone (PQQ) biosynthesis protein C